MAYFDSSKNKALWQIELQALRKEKEERKAGKTVSSARQADFSRQTVRGPERITYRELLEEEARASSKGAKREPFTKQTSKVHQKESQKEVSAKARTYEMV
ncbi:MAG: hypothetical protein E7246_07310 [Lachnoclostridium sp.]|nr:hypothetical protein [Lachnoclostridium sp.]